MHTLHCLLESGTAEAHVSKSLLKLKAAYVCFAFTVERTKGPRKRGNIVAETMFSPFARTRNICSRSKICFPESKCFLVCAARKQNNFLLPPRLRTQEIFRETMFPQQCFLVCGGLKIGKQTCHLLDKRKANPNPIVRLVKYSKELVTIII